MSAYCKGCGYVLDGSTSERCPECGRAFDLSSPRTFARRQPHPLWVRRLKNVALVLLAILLLLTFAFGYLKHEWSEEQRVIGLIRQQTYADVVTTSTAPPILRRISGQHAYLFDRVEEVVIPENSVPDSLLADLGSLHHVQRLYLNRTGLRDDQLKPISRLTGLRWLNLGADPITGPGIDYLAPLHHLEMLDLNSTKVTDDATASISRLTGLRQLYVQSTPITDRGVRELAKIKSLEVLHLSNTAVSDEGIKQLAACPELRELNLEETHITDDAIAGWGQSPPPKLEILNISGTAISDKTLEKVAAIKSLTNFFANGAQVTREGCERLKKARPDLWFVCDY